jgi:hypothetical protein
MSTDIGREIVKAYEESGLSHSRAVDKAAELIESGVKLPKRLKLKPGDKLYKLVPEGEMPGDYSAYFATKEQVQDLEGLSYDEISDKIGIPLESQQTTKFDVVEVSAVTDVTVYQSEIAGTTQAGYSQPGGGQQTLIANRKKFTIPTSTGIKLP